MAVEEKVVTHLSMHRRSGKLADPTGLGNRNLIDVHQHPKGRQRSERTHFRQLMRQLLSNGSRVAKRFPWEAGFAKHAAPAICNFSGESLFRLWRDTGDELALDLIRDIAGNITSYVSREGHRIGTMDPGMMCERVNLSDWEGQEGVGGNIFGSTIWVETALMLTVAELPGVYVRTDNGRLEIFDHVTGSWDTASKTLTLGNPTAFPAKVQVLVENAATAAAPLPLEILSRCRAVEVPAGGSVSVAV